MPEVGITITPGPPDPGAGPADGVVDVPCVGVCEADPVGWLVESTLWATVAATVTEEFGQVGPKGPADQLAVLSA